MPPDHLIIVRLQRTKSPFPPQGISPSRGPELTFMTEGSFHVLPVIKTVHAKIDEEND